MFGGKGSSSLAEVLNNGVNSEWQDWEHGQELEQIPTIEAPARFFISTGKYCELKPAYTAQVANRHFVLIFPETQGKPTIFEVAEMSSLVILAARNLARVILGDPQCYSISKNGERTGSVPEVEHFHIYLFADREEKIQTYAKNLIKALQ
jgi:hypothetical protein